MASAPALDKVQAHGARHDETDAKDAQELAGLTEEYHPEEPYPWSFLDLDRGDLTVAPDLALRYALVNSASRGQNIPGKMAGIRPFQSRQDTTCFPKPAWEACGPAGLRERCVCS